KLPHLNTDDLEKAKKIVADKINYMTGRNINIYLSEDLHQQLLPLIRERKVSRFINEAVAEKLAKEQKKESQAEFQQRLIRGYQAITKNKKLKVDLSEIVISKPKSKFPKKGELRQPIPQQREMLHIPRQVIVLPLTTEEVITGEVQPFEIPVKTNQETGLDELSRILTNRVHTIDKELRLKELPVRKESDELKKFKEERFKVIKESGELFSKMRKKE
ncbi:14576_t:CDS:2, partial [Funneliformis geosporum]